MSVADILAKLWRWWRERFEAFRDPDRMPHHVTALSTAALAIFACLAWLEAVRGTQALEGQLAVQRAGQRPWIALDMEAEGPLAQGLNGWEFIVKYSLTNVGKSPAFSVDFLATMIPLGDVQSDPPDKKGYSYVPPTKAVIAATEATCKEQDRMRDDGWGETMFPTAVPQNGRWRVHVNSGTTGFIPGFVIIGCSTYRFAGDDIIHKTWRAFELGEKAYGKMIDLSQPTIPMENLAFFRYPEHGSYAD
jgi:hypothetical protein